MCDLWLAGLLLASTISLTQACPPGCHCLPLGGGHLQAVCKWASLAPGTFTSLPVNSTQSLTVECTRSTASHFAPKMFDHFVSLRHLRIIGCSPEDGRLPEGFFQGLSNVETVYFSDLGPGLSINPGALGGLKNVHSLTLINSGLIQIPKGGLCHLRELKVLNLTNNLLANIIHSGIDTNNCDMDQLIVVDLSHNRISQLGPKDLAGLSALHVLTLDHNLIQTIDKNALTDNKLLQRLHLSHNKIQETQTLPSSLRVVDLSHNGLSMLLSTFNNASMLQQLNLSTNSIDSSLPFILKAPKLEQLDLSDNSMTKVTSLLFANISKLVELHLAGNRINSLQPESFRTLPNLQRLYLQNNRLSILKSRHLQGAANLTLLDLSSNSVVSLQDDVFDTNTNLTDLILAKNLLLEVPTALTRLYNLHTLDLSDNKLAAIHKFLFDKLPNLHVLRMGHNQLKHIDRYVFEGMQQLEELDLSDNTIETLAPQCLDRCPKLRLILLQDNRLSGVHGVFSRLSHLNLLNVTNNQITFVDFGMLPPSLQTLFIAKNELAQITNMIGKRKVELSNLDCSENRLTALKKGVLPDSIKTANLSHNSIRSVTPDLMKTKQDAEWIDLSYNEIRQLNQSSLTLAPHSQQSHIMLEGNPLECSCHMLWLKNEATQNSATQAIIEDYRTLQCSNPSTGEVDRLQKMPQSSFLCPYEVKCSVDCLCCDFDGCDCKNVCPVGCQCFHDLSMITNVVRCSNRNETLTFSPVNIPMLASHIYLDGMKLGAIAPHAFLGRYRNTHLYLNRSKVNYISPLAFNGLTSLEVLDLSDNSLTTLTGHEFVDTPKLKHLFLNGNQLQFLSSQLFAKLPNLRTLTLHRNRFSVMPPLSQIHDLQAITLGYNYWYCDCNDRFAIQSWLLQHKDMVKDSAAVTCYQGRPPSHNATTVLSQMAVRDEDVRVNFWAFHTQLQHDLCHSSVSPTQMRIPEPIPPVESPSPLLWVLVGLSALIALLLALLVVWRLRRRLDEKFSRYKAPPSLNSSMTNSTPLPITSALIHYDAFVCYSKMDEPWVLNQLTYQLENESPFYQLALLHRDLPVNSRFGVVQDNLIRAMERSHCLIIVLTPEFLNNEGDSVQVRTALECVFKAKGRRVIAVRLDESVDLDGLDPDLGKQLRTSTRLKWGDPGFWDSLRNVLPHKSAHSDCSTSAHYSDMYGPPVPSEFV